MAPNAANNPPFGSPGLRHRLAYLLRRCQTSTRPVAAWMWDTTRTKLAPVLLHVALYALVGVAVAVWLGLVILARAVRSASKPWREHGYRPWLATAVGFATVAGVGVSASAVCTYAYYASQFVPPPEVGINRQSTGAKILDRNGNVLYEYLDDRQGLRLPVSLSEVSPHLIAATIATEDASFYANPGVNPKGILRSVWENFNPLSGQFLDGSGGSSITQQLIKNVYIPETQRDDRSLTRKAREAVYAIELTGRYDKDQILEWYLNQISYGGVLNGIEAASQGYFSKSAKDLTLAEAALLTGIPSSPLAYSPVLNPEAAIERRNQVLDLLAQHDRVRTGADKYYTPSREEIEAAKQEPLVLSPKPYPIEAPHFVLSYVQPWLEERFGRGALYRDGLVVTTSLDLDLHKQAEESLEHWISAHEDASNSGNGAVVVMDPSTGEILVMIGSRDFWRDDIQGQVNNALALNSPGSAFKPFVYLTAFEKLGWGPGTLIDDGPVYFRNPDGTIFQPRNPTGTYHGQITVRNALGNSLNASAFKTAMATGVPDIVGLAERVGFTTLDGSYGPAIAIGGVDLTAFDLTYGYTVLANGGVMRGELPSAPREGGLRQLEPIAVLNVVDGDGNARYDAAEHRAEQRVVSAGHAFLVNDVLADPNARCLTFGCDGLSVPGYEMAIKTGTSEPYDLAGPNAGLIGETWAFGYTPDLVVGVWAGNADNSPVTNITSAAIAFSTMRDIALAYFDGRPASAFVQPPEVVRGLGCSAGGLGSVVDFVVRSDISAETCLVDDAGGEDDLRELLKRGREAEKKREEQAREQRKRLEEQLREQKKHQEEQGRH